MVTGIVEHFDSLPDPRRQAGRRHYLSDMLTITICAVICGADDWGAVVEFGEAKYDFFAAHLPLPHGIACEDTFERVFSRLDPEVFEQCFAGWMQALAETHDAELIAIDGKTLRRSFDRASDKAAIQMVSAWAAENELVFGQVAAEAKSNEITAIPRLLELLDLQGTTVTIDAEGCQKDIAGQIIEQGGDYVLALKANHPTMHEEVSAYLDDAIAGGFRNIAGDAHEEVHADHGRIETRRVWVTSEVSWFEDRGQWAGLQSFAAVECERIVSDKTTCERRYFISSLPGNSAEVMAHAIRSHWGIENKLHWSLDVTFGEDQSRVRTGHAAENLARLRRTAHSLLKRERTCKRGIKTKRLRAGWDNEYLLRVLRS